MLNSSVLLKILYPQPLILPCLYFFLNSPFIISDVKQHILTWHSSWKVKMHTTIIFNQKALLDMEWVHYFRLTWKMYYIQDDHLDMVWKIHIEGRKVWKQTFFLGLEFIKHKLYISIPTSWKSGKKRSNIENIGGSHFMPL